MAVKDWSTTASSNATADAANGINFAEGQAPSSLNDSMRALMAVIKGDFANSFGTTSYQKYPNGKIVQYGKASVNLNAQSNGTITFPLTFPTACRSVLVQPAVFESTNNFVQGVMIYSNLTTTSSVTFAFRPSTPSVTGVQFYYVAYGD